ncbi:tRNA (guanine(6)-N2)-methyltransferase THUMP3 [Pleurodeles waltl]|uniref:tRNA (guanine(6)-N2)-methyltransferase THUMP3 n=1 Tax=Pleurodeles waltl TaxID=8319 RepID=UPI00370991F9
MCEVKMSAIQEATDVLAEVTLNETSEPAAENHEEKQQDSLHSSPVVIGATVPTGFESMAAEEVKEKLGSISKISKDRGKIYFDISVESLSQVHLLRSVDNLFVIVQEFPDYQFKDTKDDALEDLQQLASKLPWERALEVWRLNNSVKKKKTRRKKPNRANDCTKGKQENGKDEASDVNTAEKGDAECNVPVDVGVGSKQQEETLQLNERPEVQGEEEETKENEEGDTNTEVIKFRVTCNRVGEKHSFSSNEAARDFGGAVQEHFQWKADMTKFDVEVLLNIHNNEVVVGIALTEESLHRRNITHFGPTTLRSTLAYGMIRLCDPGPADIIIDPMCGTGAIPIEGVSEWPTCFYMAADNNPSAVNRTAHNIESLLRKRQNKESHTSWGLPIDVVHWDIFNLPLRTGSVDVIVTDMPFGKRVGSRKKNWDLYPAFLREMSRICRPRTGRAVLLTHDKKCFVKALSQTGHLWRKSHTVWVNVGGLHAGVFLLRRTSNSLNGGSAGKQVDRAPVVPVEEAEGDKADE